MNINKRDLSKHGRKYAELFTAESNGRIYDIPAQQKFNSDFEKNNLIAIERRNINKKDSINWDRDFQLGNDYNNDSYVISNPYDFFIGNGHNFFCDKIIDNYRLRSRKDIENAVNDYIENIEGLKGFTNQLKGKGVNLYDTISYENIKEKYYVNKTSAEALVILDQLFNSLSIIENGSNYQKINTVIQNLTKIEYDIWNTKLKNGDREFLLRISSALKFSSAYWYSFFYNKLPLSRYGIPRNIDIDIDPFWMASDAAGYMLAQGTSIAGWGALVYDGLGWLGATVGIMGASSLASVLKAFEGGNNSSVFIPGETITVNRYDETKNLLITH